MLKEQLASGNPAIPSTGDHCVPYPTHATHSRHRIDRQWTLLTGWGYSGEEGVGSNTEWKSLEDLFLEKPNCAREKR